MFTSFTSRLLPEETVSTWDTNKIFLLAVFVAVSKSTVSGTIQHVEAYTNEIKLYIYDLYLNYYKT